MAAEPDTHLDKDGLTVWGGRPDCEHVWEEMPEDERGVPKDVCVSCGGVKY